MTSERKSGRAPALADAEEASKRRKLLYGGSSADVWIALNEYSVTARTSLDRLKVLKLADVALWPLSYEVT